MVPTVRTQQDICQYISIISKIDKYIGAYINNIYIYITYIT